MIIQHYSAFKTRWDWIVLTLTFYTAVEVPFVVAFRIKPRNVWLMINSMVDVFFLVDIVFNFYTTYTSKSGKVVRELKKIRIHYLKTWFLLDMVACLPYDALLLFNRHILNENVAHMVGILKSCRLLRSIRFARDIDRYMHHAWATLAVLASLILLICHWLACGWYGVALWNTKEYLRINKIDFSLNEDFTIADPRPNNLLFNLLPTFTEDRNTIVTYFQWEGHSTGKKLKRQLTDDSTPHKILNATMPKNWVIKMAESSQISMEWDFQKDEMVGGPPTSELYIVCLYFTMTALTGSGFGNVAADSVNEQLYCIFMLVLGGLLYATILGNVTNLIVQMMSEQQMFSQILKSVKKFVKLNELPSYLSDSIADYVTFSYLATHGICLNKVMDRLSAHLQTDLSFFLYGKLAESLFNFEDLPQSSIRYLASKFERVRFAPNDIVYECGSKVAHVSFVVTGSLEIVQNHTVVGIIDRGDSFGADFWTKMRLKHPSVGSRASIRALTYVAVARISEKHFIDMNRFCSEKLTEEGRLNITYDLEKQTVTTRVAAVQWMRLVSNRPEIAKRDQILKRWILKHRRKIKLREKKKKRRLDAKRGKLNKVTPAKPTALKAIEEEFGDNVFGDNGSCGRNMHEDDMEKIYPMSWEDYIRCARCEICHSNENDDSTTCFLAREEENNTYINIMTFRAIEHQQAIQPVSHIRVSLECGCWTNLPLAQCQKDILHSILKLKVDNGYKLRELNQRMRLIESKILKLSILVKNFVSR